MQKFKVTKKEFLRHFPSQTALAKFMNDEFILEGKLLEGGTVEKCETCGEGCTFKINNVCTCWCHNKKEEESERLFDLNYHDKEKLKILFAQAIDGKFNRETPKEHPCKRPCVHDIAEEEARLLEKLTYQSSNGFSYPPSISELMNKINEIILYLASLKAHDQ